MKNDDAFLKRMYAEAKELEDKVDKLRKFFGTYDGRPFEINREEAVRVRNQRRVMEMYLEILNERITAHS